jgi:uncharacterized protein (DUF2252 family)
MPTCIERIEAFNRGRIPDMLRVKYGLMRKNLFGFYRGTCHLFYEDLHGNDTLPASPLVWVCGDLHLENFGSYKGDNRLVYFDLNDFDDALLAPAAYELTRMICSMFVAFDSLKVEEAKAIKMGRLFLKNYAQVLSKGKSYYIEPQTSKGIVHTFLMAVSKRKEKQILEKRTVRKRDSLAILLEHPRHFKLEDELRSELMKHINEWITHNSYTPYNFEAVDVAFRLAGTGSLGLKRYIFLLKSTNRKNKYMLMEMKQAAPPALKKYLGFQQPEWESEAQRIVNIQQRMQNIPPALLSYTLFRKESFIVQEMQPMKDSFDFKFVRDRYRDLFQIIDDMSTLTASAEIRSSGWKGASVVDELSTFGDNKNWQEAILEYARQYKRTMQLYYAEFCGASLGKNPVKLKKKKQSNEPGTGAANGA